MGKNLSKDTKLYKFIYNPQAGGKRKFLPSPKGISLEETLSLLEKYQLPVELFPTQYPGHATILAREAINQKYKMVIVAGGDGTVGEAANGLIGSDMPLGILPFGSFMNIARMLSIPLDLEKAVALIKIGRTRTIDAGVVTKIGGDTSDLPYYFIESAGIGFEAQLHKYFLDFERGDYKALFRVVRTFFDYWGFPVKILIDKKTQITTRAPLVTISNGPYSGTAIPLAPEAKLNDHRLTVSIFRMSKTKLLKFFIALVFLGKRIPYKVQTIQARDVALDTKIKRLVHADARFFGITPAEFSILPNALKVVTGFPDKGESSLSKRTYLDP